MPPYGEPDWATPGSTANDTVQNTGIATGNTAAMPSARMASGGSNDHAGCILTVLSVFDIGLAVMMAALGVLTLLDFNNPNDLSEAFLAVYMILFACLLFGYELMWWMTIPWVNKILRKNFGFMYGLRGKGFYLIFVAFLCIGLGDDNSNQTLTWATGISYLVFGALHIFIVFVHPTISLKYQAPTAGLLANENNDGTSGGGPNNAV